MSTVSILISLALGVVAFGAARNSEDTLSRILGLGYLVARGGMLIAAGSFGDKGPLPISVGVGMLVLAGVAWWQGRS